MKGLKPLSLAGAILTILGTWAVIAVVIIGIVLVTSPPAHSSTKLTGILVSNDQVILNCSASERSASPILDQVIDCICTAGLSHASVYGTENPTQFRFKARGKGGEDITGFVAIVSHEKR